MDLTFHVSPWEIWGVIVLVWGLVVCSWQKERKELKVVKGKVEGSGGETENKRSTSYKVRGEAPTKTKGTCEGLS